MELERRKEVAHEWHRRTPWRQNRVDSDGCRRMGIEHRHEAARRDTWLGNEMGERRHCNSGFCDTCCGLRVIDGAQGAATDLDFTCIAERSHVATGSWWVDVAIAPPCEIGRHSNKAGNRRCGIQTASRFRKAGEREAGLSRRVNPDSNVDILAQRIYGQIVEPQMRPDARPAGKEGSCPRCKDQTSEQAGARNLQRPLLPTSPRGRDGLRFRKR